MSQPDLQLNTDRDGRLKLREQLNILRLSPVKQRKLVREMAKSVRKQARQNIKGQRTVSGSAMTQRADTRNKRKLLRGMGRQMVVFNRGNTQAVVTWKDRKTAQIAAAHQRGTAQTMTASRAARIAGATDYKGDCSRTQAKALVAEGYKHPVKGKKGKRKLKRVSVKWIMENMTLGQAGLILKTLRNTHRRKSWTIRTPARPFLGADANDIDSMMATLARQSLASLKAKGAI